MLIPIVVITIDIDQKQNLFALTISSVANVARRARGIIYNAQYCFKLYYYFNKSDQLYCQ